MAGEIIIHEGRRSLVQMFLVMVGFSLLLGGANVGVYYMGYVSAKLIVFTVMAIGMTAWAGIKAFLPAGVLLTLTPVGLKSNFGAVRVMPWQEITAIEVKKDKDALNVYVSTKKEWISIAGHSLPGTPEELVSVLKQYRENVTGTPMPAANTSASSASGGRG